MPRAATIQASTDGVLWALDRQTFRRIVLRNAFQKRKMYEALIENVPLLSALSVSTKYPKEAFLRNFYVLDTRNLSIAGLRENECSGRPHP